MAEKFNLTVTEAWNRGNNLVSTAVVALAGFAFAPELIMETEWQFKIDDTLLLILGVSAIAWYRKGNHRFTRSIVPVLLVLASLLVKIGAVMIEFRDKEDVGDDFGGLVLFVCAVLLVTWLYFRPKSQEM